MKISVQTQQKTFEGEIGKLGKQQFVFANGTGINNLPNCTTQDYDNFDMCRSLVLEEVRNVTLALQLQISEIKDNETLVHQAKQEFWCSTVPRHVRLLGACVRPCKTPGICIPVAQPTDNRRLDDHPAPLDGPHCFSAGFDTSVSFCLTQMNITQEYYPDFNDNRDLESIMNDYNCPDTCDNLVQQGLDVALLAYQDSVLSSSGQSLMTSSLAVIFAIASALLS